MINIMATDIYETIKNYTMCRPERFSRFCQALLDTRNIPGSIVECGVWKGGMLCGGARFAIDNNISRTYYAFDSFEGFPEPTEKDIVAYTNEKALDMENWGMKRCPSKSETLGDLYDCMKLLNISENVIVPVKGWFNDTVPAFDKPIVILRLDGDWYDSTKVCLEHLYPKVEPGGIIILDDYGYWKGCKEATDEYLQKNNINVTINKTDFSEIWFVKP